MLTFPGLSGLSKEAESDRRETIRRETRRRDHSDHRPDTDFAVRTSSGRPTPSADGCYGDVDQPNRHYQCPYLATSEIMNKQQSDKVKPDLSLISDWSDIAY